MSIFEYNEEEELKKLRQAEFRIGKEEGREEGRETGIRALILDNLELGGSREQILRKLEKYFGVMGEKAEGYLERYSREEGCMV